METMEMEKGNINFHLINNKKGNAIAFLFLFTAILLLNIAKTTVE
jgi:hypothetical protein